MTDHPAIGIDGEPRFVTGHVSIPVTVVVPEGVDPAKAFDALDADVRQDNVGTMFLNQFRTVSYGLDWPEEPAPMIGINVVYRTDSACSFKADDK